MSCAYVSRRLFFLCFVQSRRVGIPDTGNSFCPPSLVSAFIVIWKYNTQYWTEPRPAATGNVKKKRERNKKSKLWCHRFCQNALSAGIGSKQIISVLFWEQNQMKRSATLLNCQMVLQLSHWETLGTLKYTFYKKKKKAKQTAQNKNKQINCKQRLFCPSSVKMVFGYNFRWHWEKKRLIWNCILPVSGGLLLLPPQWQVRSLHCCLCSHSHS